MCRVSQSQGLTPQACVARGKAAGAPTERAGTNACLAVGVHPYPTDRFLSSALPGEGVWRSIAEGCPTFLHELSKRWAGHRAV